MLNKTLVFFSLFFFLLLNKKWFILFLWKKSYTFENENGLYHVSQNSQISTYGVKWFHISSSGWDRVLSHFAIEPFFSFLFFSFLFFLFLFVIKKWIFLTFLFVSFKNSGESRSRTYNVQIMSLMSYQLLYSAFGSEKKCLLTFFLINQ